MYKISSQNFTYPSVRHLHNVGLFKNCAPRFFVVFLIKIVVLGSTPLRDKSVPPHEITIIK